MANEKPILTVMPSLKSPFSMLLYIPSHPLHRPLSFLSPRAKLSVAQAVRDNRAKLAQRPFEYSLSRQHWFIVGLRPAIFELLLLQLPSRNRPPQQRQQLPCVICSSQTSILCVKYMIILFNLVFGFTIKFSLLVSLSCRSSYSLCSSQQTYLNVRKQQPGR